MSPEMKNRVGWIMGLSTLLGGIPLTAFATWVFYTGGIVQDVHTFKTETVPAVRQLQLTTIELNKVLENDLKKINELSTQTSENSKHIQNLQIESGTFKTKIENQTQIMEEVRGDLKDVKKMMVDHLIDSKPTK